MLIVVTKNVQNYQTIVEDYQIKNEQLSGTLSIENSKGLIIFILLMTIGIMLILAYLIYIQSRNITEPLNELHDQMKKIDSEDNQTNQFVCKRGNRFKEMKMLYEGFNKLIKVFKFGKHKQEILNDTYDLIYNF